MKPSDAPPSPEEQAVLDAVRDCPDRGELIPSSLGTRCGPKHWCLDREEPVRRVDCIACRFKRLFPGGLPQ